MFVFRRRVLRLHLVQRQRFRRARPAQLAVVRRTAIRVPVHEHGVAMPHRQLLLLPVGLSEYRKVCKDHYCARYPERY